LEISNNIEGSGLLRHGVVSWAAESGFSPWWNNFLGALRWRWNSRLAKNQNICNMLGTRAPCNLYWPLPLLVALIISMCQWFWCIKQSWFLLYQDQTVFSYCLIL